MNPLFIFQLPEKGQAYIIRLWFYNNYYLPLHWQALYKIPILIYSGERSTSQCTTTAFKRGSKHDQILASAVTYRWNIILHPIGYVICQSIWLREILCWANKKWFAIISQQKRCYYYNFIMNSPRKKSFSTVYYPRVFSVCWKTTTITAKKPSITINRKYIGWADEKCWK